MYCPNCGNELKDKAIYCHQCGTKIKYPEVKKEEIKVDNKKYYAVVGILILITIIFTIIAVMMPLDENKVLEEKNKTTTSTTTTTTTQASMVKVRELNYEFTVDNSFKVYENNTVYNDKLEIALKITRLKLTKEEKENIKNKFFDNKYIIIETLENEYNSVEYIAYKYTVGNDIYLRILANINNSDDMLYMDCILDDSNTVEDYIDLYVNLYKSAIIEEIYIENMPPYNSELLITKDLRKGE